MLSILIPTYNYNIVSLVTELHKQCVECNIKFEILVYDDGSNKYANESKQIAAFLSETRIIFSDKNLGRIHARQKLSDNAQYDWLLFLDADVLPKSKKFIERYTLKTNSCYDAVFGGFAYTSNPPENHSILRWKYGKTFEEVDAKKRNSKPYHLIISANFLIKKEIFHNINSKIKINSYGLDNYFAALLKQNNIHILHVNNEVYHFGIEKNIVYLNKVEEAINTLLYLFNKNKIFTHNNKLLSTFIKTKRFKLNILLAHLYKKFNKRIKSNLLSHNPNMFLLQLYKTLYMCHLDLKTNQHV